LDSFNEGMGAAKDSRVSLLTEIPLSIVSAYSLLIILLAKKNKRIDGNIIKLLVKALTRL
jgi:hypothetical protein